MLYRFHAKIALLSIIASLFVSSNAFAGREGASEAAFVVPYLYGERYEFEGGASAEFNSDAGFGFNISHFYSNNLAMRFDFMWNSVGYSATRVLDDNQGTTEKVGGRLDSFNMGFGADYYFGNGKVSPFVSGNLGWNFTDTNIPAGPSGSVCWWDPWWGYICQGYQPTHTETNYYYGVGGGIRADFARDKFLKIGYYTSWIDFDHSSDSAELQSLRIEFGSSF